MVFVSLIIITGLISQSDGNYVNPGSAYHNAKLLLGHEGECYSGVMCLVSFWRGRLVETIDKWEAEYEIEIRIKLTGRELDLVMIADNIIF